MPMKTQTSRSQPFYNLLRFDYAQRPLLLASEIRRSVVP
jgi:hypothetical protein